MHTGRSAGTFGAKGDALKVINTSQLISGQGATYGRILRSTCFLIALAEVGPPGEVKYLLASQVIPVEELESLKPSPKEG